MIIVFHSLYLIKYNAFITKKIFLIIARILSFLIFNVL